MSDPVVFAPIPDLDSDRWLCPCTVLYPDQLSAARCARGHQKAARRPLPPPVVPGDALMRPAAYRPIGPRDQVGPRTYARSGWVAGLGLVLVISAVVVLVALVAGAVVAGRLDGPPAPAVPPSTTPAPCRTGGAVCR